MNFKELNHLFHPESVAIVGASENEMSAGYAYTKFLLEHFDGDIYPINPNLDRLLGLETYSNLGKVRCQIDYVISCISAEKIPDLIEECGKKDVQIVHLFTARMSETGREERKKLERNVLKKAKNHGVRLLGPNCMGVYNPDAGLSYNYDFPSDSGCVGIVSQSGGASNDLVHYGKLRGLRFSKVFSYGNGLDIDESELLRYLADDPETNLIALYIEGVEDGEEFRNSLSYAAKRKPVVVLKGGKTKAGERSVRSHTASMAGSEKVWSGVVSQCGAVEVENFQELLDQIVAFRFIPKTVGNKLLIAGGGGGKSALSADLWGKEGFEIPKIPQDVREKLKEKTPEVWDWLENPVDFSILQDSFLTPKELVKMFEDSEKVDFFIFNLTTGDFLPKDIWRLWMEEQKKSLIELRENKPLLVVAQSIGIAPEGFEEWRWREIEELRKEFVENDIPVFSSPNRAAKVLKRSIKYWKKQDKA